MDPMLPALLLIPLLVGVALGWLAFGRGRSAAADPRLDQLQARITELQASLATGFATMRDELAVGARHGREELGTRLDGLSATLTGAVGSIGTAQGERLDMLFKQVSSARIEAENHAKNLRGELTGSFESLGKGLNQRMADQTAGQARTLEGFGTALGEHRAGSSAEAKALRDEVGATLSTVSARLGEGLELASRKQAEALDRAARSQAEGLVAATGAIREMGSANEVRHETLRQTVEGRLDNLRTENAAKLEEMRVTVDEKLQGTLEARLGASFSTVNENLERVFKSVGEMQTIATGVGDLKRVLTNVKSRGTWGEVRLGMLIEQVMSPEQYGTNVEVKPGSGCRVEFAVRLPGDGDAPLWLPIDAKLPTEDYERLVIAAESGDPAAVEEAARGLERAIRKCGSDIATKYIDPPRSTDFGVMFLPNEGLFAEVVRRPGLVDALRRDCRVIVAGPTTLEALLASLRMGFRTLAIQQRSSEVWQVLGAVKTEFGKFGGVLDKVQKKLEEAQNVVHDAGVRRRAVDRRLKGVEAMPEAQAHALLALAPETGDEPEVEAAA